MMDQQQAQDLINAIVAQRNRAQDNEVHLMAQLAATQREIEGLKAELEKLRAQGTEIEAQAAA